GIRDDLVTGVQTCALPILGNHFSLFEIAGVRCGALICHEYRYPELYREYKRRGVELMFHSYHAGHVTAERFQAMRDAVGERLQQIGRASCRESVCEGVVAR